MRLGDLIDTLEGFAPDTPVFYGPSERPSEFTSWRGRYDELTLVPGNKPMTVGKLLDLARKADGGTFTGYKGGEYTMSRDTPVWADDYGDCNYNAITGIVSASGSLVLVTQVIEEYVW